MLGTRKRGRPDEGFDLFRRAFDEAGRSVHLLVRAGDLRPVHVSANFERVFRLPPERMDDDIEALYRLIEPETRRSIRHRVDAWDGVGRLWFDFPFTADGDDEPCFFRCTVERVLDGFGYLVSFDDAQIERERMDELRGQLRDLSTDAQVKTDFLNKMSHEIRTPLNGIVGLLELARTHGGQPDELARDLDEAAGLGQFLMSLVNDILDMSRLEAGKVELERRPFDLASLAEDVRSIFGHSAAERDVAFAVELKECEDRFVVGDRLRLGQVIVNLVSNALKFTPAGGSVTVTFQEMRRRDGRAHYLVRVRDTGKGIDPQFLGRIFRPFEQEDGSIAPTFGGSGLDMAIADSLVRLMGGEIVIDSEVGRGSDMSVYLALDLSDEATVAASAATAEASRWTGELLHAAERAGGAESVALLPHPAAPAEPAAPADPAPAPVPAADSPLAGLRMLLAEDNDVNARITTSLLKLRGIDVVRARIGEEALELYEDSEPGGFDAVLMDIKMPGMDGWEAARRIRASARPDAQRIALVALSANAFAEDARRSRAVGMDGHIGKPVDFDELEALFGRIRSGRCKGKDNA